MSYLNLANAYWRKKFGCKIYRLSVAGGSSCPNRDGACGVGGCIFCAEGSGSFTPIESDINAELDAAKALVADKCRQGRFIAYFQSFTATWGDTQELYSRIKAAFCREDIVAASVATRPDCLPDSVVNELSELNKIKPIYVELGLQTASDVTARLINRGYETAVYTDACRRLHAAGLEIIAHMIIGLPNETKQDMLDTVRLIGETADGVKLQLMHVLRDTKLHEMYERGEYQPLELDEYAELLFACIEHLPEHTVIHRMTGDGDKWLLIAPMWSADKKRTLNYINSQIGARNIIQGKLYNG